MSAGTTRAEREDILRLARQRERVAKSDAKRRTAELRADFEAKLAAEFSYDQSAIWKQGAEAAQRAVRDADKRIAEECERLGIPRAFRPSLSVVWFDRGENATARRRAELRKVAETRLAAIEKRAIEIIERNTLNVSTSVIAEGLSSPRARELLASMPSVEQLMPPLDMKEVQAALARGPQAVPFEYGRRFALDYDTEDDAEGDAS
jgi:hypothetical protein